MKLFKNLFRKLRDAQPVPCWTDYMQDTATKRTASRQA